MVKIPGFALFCRFSVGEALVMWRMLLASYFQPPRTYLPTAPVDWLRNYPSVLCPHPYFITSQA
jgi:hypothetical protein